MRCEVARRHVSAGLDGGLVDARVKAHLQACAGCRSFEIGAWRLRELVRLEPAPPVPDLASEIMERVRGEVEGSSRGWGREAVAFVAAALATSLVLGGLPLVRPRPAPVEASEIPRRLASASAEVAAYRATYRIVERHFAPAVPLRRFDAAVTYRAPERFRAQIVDRTAYPGPSWPRNDVVVAVDGDRWSASGPRACPREALPACAPRGVEVRAVRGRAPFDADALLPTDVVLPLRTLADAGRLHVLASGSDAVRVEVDYRDATPLFSYLHAAGSWRPFFPLDRVEIDLDPETWFPLGYRVRAADVAERDAWALRSGLPRERPGLVLFEARVRSFGTAVGEGWTPRVASPAEVRDRGFRDVAWEEVAGLAGHAPAAPADLAGLRPYRAGVREGSAEVVTSYARGLSWLAIRETRSWRGPGAFGDVGPFAEPVELPGGGVGYHEPPTGWLGRRLAIHGEGTDLYVETNLSRAALLRVAGSLPVRGLVLPEEWRTRRIGEATLRQGVPLPRAMRSAPFLLRPALPAAYAASPAEVYEHGTSTAVTVVYRRVGGEPGGEGIRVHQASGVALPPPTDPGTLAVEVRGRAGRYSPLRGELEWVEEGVYRSVRAEGLGLAEVLEVAASLGRRPR